MPPADTGAGHAPTSGTAPAGPPGAVPGGAPNENGTARPTDPDPTGTALFTGPDASGTALLADPGGEGGASSRTDPDRTGTAFLADPDPRGTAYLTGPGARGTAPVTGPGPTGPVTPPGPDTTGSAPAPRTTDPVLRTGPDTAGAAPDVPAAAEPGDGDCDGDGDCGSNGYSDGRDGDVEDTLDLHLPDEFLALFRGPTRTGNPWADPERHPAAVPAPARTGAVSPGGGSPLPQHSAPHPFARTPLTDDLLDGVGDWGPVDTPAGVFELVPVRLDRDLPVVSRWMNDPAVAAFWQLAGPRGVTEAHLRAQLDGDGRSVPCLGLIGGAPMSYWEIYRADLDPLARYYPARPHDTGLHLLLGRVADRGRGLGGTLLRAVADLVLDQRAACARVVAEPDLRNTPSVAAFLSAGFRFFGEVDLPAKRAALVIRDRSLRHRL